MTSSEIVDNDGLRLSIEVDGGSVDGRPDLLFVHGLGSAQVLWRPFIAALRDRFRCWNLDLRGHGQSDRTPGEYRRETYASDVAAALDHIGSPTIGIGHSLGGGSLVHVATEGHDMLHGVYAVDSSLFPTAEVIPAIYALFENQLNMLRAFQPEGRPVSDYEDRLAAAPASTGGTNRESMLPEQLYGRAESLSQLDPGCIEAVLANPTRAGLIDPKVTVPFRFLGADPDRGASLLPEHVDMIGERMPHAQVDNLVGVGHQMMMMRGFDDLVLADLEAFLAAQS